MKLFTEKDLCVGTYPNLYTQDTADLLHSPLVWQERGLQQTATGYGKKLTSQYKISYCGKLYRLYNTCYSNVASTWFVCRGKKIFVH